MQKKRDSRITVDLLEHKQAWLDHCESQGTTPSAAFRQIVQTILSKKSGQSSARLGLGSVVIDEPEKASVRKKIGLTPSESERVDAAARADGFSSTRWIVALIRAKLIGKPQFGQQELEALVQSNMRLLQIGRNLNQLAKAVNTSPELEHRIRVEMIERLTMAIKDHTQVVSNEMAANIERWRLM